jgi:ABC-type multidrug transport system ATPase subunit
MNSICVEHISKSYGKVQALKDVSFEVKPNEIFGLIGPDGSGKSTMFRILTTLLIPNEGQARVEGFDTIKDYKAIRNMVGYMPGHFSLYQDLTVEENMKFFAALFHTTVEANYHLIENIYKFLAPFKGRRAGKLSGGMKQKLALCCALIHKPKVLFLDEPTTGVDPVSRNEFWDILDELKKEGITILVSTPYMDEASRCQRIGLIKDGKILQIDTPQRIVEQYGNPLFRVRSNNMHQLLQDVRSYQPTKACFPFGEYHHVTFDSSDCDITAFHQYLTEKGHHNLEINAIEADIEDCYLKLT